jgi:hypothetical protein
MEMLACIYCETPLVIRQNHAYFKCLCDEEIRTVPLGSLADIYWLRKDNYAQMEPSTSN